MDKYFKSIDRQIAFNQGKNLLLDDQEKIFGFVAETIKAISELNAITADAEKILIDYATDKALEEFYRINQYYAFNSQAKKDLRNIYAELFARIKSQQEPAETISKDHYQNLKRWLVASNPFAGKIYSGAGASIDPVPCSEYDPELQMNILGINRSRIIPPVLDIGCGKQGNLVKYLNKNGIEAYGIDRFSFPEKKLIYADWLEFDYGLEKWGTIVSNLGFSNHFSHHHAREDGNYIEYAKKYMDILKSLKTGGRFHYAPELVFIEQYLDAEQYKIEKKNIGDYDFKASIILRMK